MFAIGYNNSEGHYSNNYHCENPNRILYTIEKLKKVYPISNFVTIDSINTSKCVELISLAHSKKHVDFLLNPTFYFLVCRQCKKQMSLYEKLTFDQFIENQEECSQCKTKLTVKNIYAQIDADTYFTSDTSQIIFEAVNVLD
jgi:acetoin utilization deacetylase AcuC-like enzyme